MKAFTVQLVLSLLAAADAFAPSSRFSTTPNTRQNINMNMLPHIMESTDLLLADKEYGEVVKTALIALTLGGGLIPALINANQSMMKTLSGKKETQEEEIDPKTVKPGESFDPTLLETKYRKYVSDSGATGPDLAMSSLLFATDRIPLADIVAILGRIQNVDSIADWRNLPSTKMKNVSLTDPPMWLPRKAFKVNVRKSKFLGWPNDSKTGLPVGGEELKSAEMARVSKAGAGISDAALDAVFDSWAWGASVATPDKVTNTLNLYRSSPSEVDLGAFVGAAIRGRSATGIAALTFIIIQLVVFGSLFIAPTLRFLFDIDIGFGTFGAQ